MSDPKVTDPEYFKWLEEICDQGDLNDPRGSGDGEDGRKMPWESGADPMSIDDV